MSGWLLGLAAAALVVYVGLCIALAVFQRSLIYYPQPSSLGDRDTTLALPSSDVRVVASARAQAGPNAVIYFGGNGEDVTRSVPELERAFPGHALYLMHYRGYGASAGTPSEAAIVADALALFDHVHGEHRSVVAMGRSLGSGVAVRVASARPVAGLVLVTPYDSLVAIGAARFPYFPVRWLMQDRFESGRHAAAVDAPTLMLAAEHDEIIPRASTDLLLSRFKPGVASLKVLAGVDHNSISAHPDYERLLQAWAKARP